MSIKSPHRFLAQVAAAHPVRVNRFTVSVAGMAAAGVLATCAVAAAPKPEKVAASAQTALSKGKVEKAIALAEQAVALDPHKADWRVVLGDSYLRAGRFVSARQAYEQALQLGNDKGRTALALSLMQISQGQYAQASDTLSAYRDSIPASDYGLALALSGQTGQGVAVLADALRQGDNSPKIRQNLAYAFALDGKWPMARAMVEQDLPADKVDDRLSQWALAGQPEDTQKRVAMLLGTPLRGDTGQPAALALAVTPPTPGAAPKAVAAAQSSAAPVLARAAATELPPLASEPSAPVVDVSGRSAQAEAPAAAPAMIDANADAPAVLQNIKVQNAASAEQAVQAPARAMQAPAVQAPAVQAPVASVPVRVPTVRQPVAQQTVAPAPVVRHIQVAKAEAARAQPARTKPQPIAPVYAATGNVAVQLGAFATPEGAQRALRHYSARHTVLGGHQLSMVKVQVANKTYWRVLATGFAGRSASAACHSVTSGGGACFVRADLSRFQPSKPVGYARNVAKPVPHNAVAPGFARRK